ncbi:glycosyltransferase family 2 protein [Collybiopsis luxurians FD-317 M1]|uniref:chitin synthase n=1 Tax=Collybiopsis luxurians FD-317 M1 TaxID=944289 RepID=A0A0D0ARS0_9AGAR|nr:glycosyltransferase family 2 protein [Collybiopsis luxurians FD-317 M1]
MASHHTTQSTASGELLDLVSSSGAATIYPTPDPILSVLQSRFRADLPYTRIGSSNLVVVNPFKTLGSVGNASAKEYEERCYRDTSQGVGADRPKELQPHVYDFAARMYLVMRRRKENQIVLARGITGSGKTSTLRLLTNQILRLSSHSSKESKTAEQITALHILLDSFGNSKMLLNPNASRHSRYLQLHFTDKGRISGAKILTYALDKSRLGPRLGHEERSFHVFYQIIAGCTSQERDLWGIEDLSDYALLASSGTYRLPAGPFSDDSIAMGDLRAAMRSLGFKPKVQSAIFQLVIAILLLGNLEFGEGDFHDVSAFVSNVPVLDQVARMLGVGSEEFAQALTNKTSYVKKELYTVLLNGEQAAKQRDGLVRDLYAILFAFVVETANHKLAGSSSSPPATQIVLLDQPGFQSRNPTGTNSMALAGSQPLVSAYGQNSFDEFIINFQDEMLQSFYIRHTFNDEVGYNAMLASDGVSLPEVSHLDNSSCIEMLKGGLVDRRQRKPLGMLGIMGKASSAMKQGKGDNARRDAELEEEIKSKVGVHSSFSPNPFTINHYEGGVTYSLESFVEKDTDLLDPSFVSLLRSSADPFIAKLFSGPGVAAEKHWQDESIVVQAQVSSRPLRTLTPLVDAEPDTSEEASELDRQKTYPVTTQVSSTLTTIFSSLSQAISSSRAHLWTISCIRPNDSLTPNSFDKRRVRAQIKSLLLADIASRKHSSADFILYYPVDQFCDRYVGRMQGSPSERITQCARANGWQEGEDFVVGNECIWLGYGAWKSVEDGVRAAEKEGKRNLEGLGMEHEPDSDEERVYDDVGGDDGTEYTHGTGEGGYAYGGVSSRGLDDDVLETARSGGTYRNHARGASSGTGYNALPIPQTDNNLPSPTTPAYPGATPNDSAWGSDWDAKNPENPFASAPSLPRDPNAPKDESSGLIVNSAPHPSSVEEVPSTRSRRFWLWTVWLCTFWIPTFLLRHVGRMKRPDVRLAWREKVTIFWLIFLFNGIVIFYVVIFGRIVCPDYDNAWTTNELAQHTASNDYYVAIQGQVYDVSNFVKGQHSDIQGEDSNTDDVLDALAGQDLTGYFPVPLVLGCQDLVIASSGSQDVANQMKITFKNFSKTEPTADHSSGEFAQSTTSALHNSDWYLSTFQPTIKKYHKGALVHDWKEIQGQAEDDSIQKIWGVYRNKLYDLTDYFNTQTVNENNDAYKFIDSGIEDVFKDQSGQDITKPLDEALGNLNATYRESNLDCLNNVFYVGETDFRQTPRCQAPNITLIVVSAILMSTMVLKFLSALQLAPKRNPELQDKFILCQVPCYTEGEDSLRRTIDSLAALNYDDKRKLIFIICDGNITGSGNDRTTPRIVLDILGVDPALNPEPLMFKSVGEGARALNYGKVYSGLYEFEGHVVPYMVVVKVGKPTERSKPGNRGKRDSQILLMHYLNRVHFDAPMSPLELELYHQMRNVIGIDPAFYEYIFTVDADTTVTPESLNRLVATAAIDSSIIGICGETKVANEDTSWWTMIQVYEYYISHHLTKAFESLFGSVTCLPGCFSLYRIRTADKGRPIIISNRVIDEYAEPNVDTLHKKNLFSLGEDRFLTTLLMKHFPTFKTKFNPDAVAHTVAPDSTRVLFSQRRRWINSTVHNLCELFILPELIGFCCFSMRIFVFIDLLSTIILPATVVYLFYLIIAVSLGRSPFPLIAIILIAAGYGLQALIFILKREFMLVGWMIVYLISYPVYSFFLPVYSFWCMDEFGWGNTRLVIGEGRDKKVIINDDDKFDESMIPLKKFSEYEADAFETGSRHSDETGLSKPRSQARQPMSRAGSPYNYQQGSQAGDYYRDTNFLNRSNPAMASQQSFSNISHHGPPQQFAPQLPYLPFSGGPGSAAGSDYGGHTGMPMGPPAMPMGYQGTGSMYGMPMGMGMGMGMGMNPMVSPMMSGMMTGGSFGAGAGSQSGAFAPPTMPAANQETRPMSTFSMATTVNPFASSGPSQNPNPSDDELFSALRSYLGTQDLMTVTKKTAREAMAAKFPKADLASRKDFLNKSIDSILAE